MRTDTITPVRVKRYAEMFSAMGAEPRLKILRLLLNAYPNGLTVSEIQASVRMPGSTLSHHLEKLKNEDLVRVRREGTFLRYSANQKALEQLLNFFFAECGTLNRTPEQGLVPPVAQ